ncbi:MAG: nuclear transport factor 2 family protein [Gammaproteobacteria bacterium]|nr:nuclear transport factor 2 family protein [Gammaproteobacteria bacterium]
MSTPSTTAAEAETIVRGFLDAWRIRNLDHLMSFFTEDAVYHNVPVEPIVGAPAIRAIFEAFLGAFVEAELEVITLAAGPDLVLAERIDRFLMANGNRVALPVTGVFVIAGGRIARFSDYFDLATFVRESGMQL